MSEDRASYGTDPWDTQIEEDGQPFAVLEDGTECDCTVLEFEPGTTNAGNPMAVLRIACVAPEGRTVVEERLAIQKNCEWKLCEFFKALGMRVHGQRLRITRETWDSLKGAQFRATVSKEPWRNNPERFSNKIKQYLEPVGQTTPAAGEEVSFG